MKSPLSYVGRSFLITALGLTAAAQIAIAQYSKAVLADKPVAYYRLGESVGSTVATDSSSSGFNGVYEGSPLLGLQGLINDPNTAVDFSNGDVVIDDQPNMNFVTAPFSIEAWINATQFPDFNVRIFDKALAGAAQGYGLDVRSEQVRMLGNQEFQVFNLNLTAGTTYHIVVVSNGAGKGFVYLNGVLIGSGPYMDSNPYTGPAHIAVASDGTVGFQGVIDEVAIYNKALSAARVLAHYRAGTGVKLVPQNLNFGSQLVGTSSAPKTTILTNISNTFMNVVAIAATGDFAQTNDCPATLSPKAHCTISVVFSPSGKGSRTGVVNVTDNFPGSPHQVSLKGKGTVAN